MSRRAYRRPAIVCVLLLLAVACSGGSQTSTEATSSTAPTRAPSTAPTRAPSSASQGITYVDPQRYEVTYRVTAENTGFNVDRFLLYQPKPVGWDGQSKVHIESVMPTPTHAAADPIGNEIYSWDMSRIPSSGSDQAFVIRFTLTASATHTNLEPKDAAPYDRSSNMYRRYTAAERYIESDDAQIKKLEARLAGGAADPLTLTRRFYDYVIDNSRYVLTGTGLHGAKALLESGKGECGDYAALFVALSRAAGIPARPVVGYWAKSGLDQTHVWAEFFVQGEGWVPVDPTMGQRVPADRDFYFGNMDNERVILNKGYNVSLEPAAPDGFVAQFLQVPLWWFWGSGNGTNVALDRTSWEVKQLN